MKKFKSVVMMLGIFIGVLSSGSSANVTASNLPNNSSNSNNGIEEVVEYKEVVETDNTLIVLPKNSIYKFEDKTIKYKVTNSNIASLSKDGIIKGLSNGVCVVLGEDADGKVVRRIPVVVINDSASSRSIKKRSKPELATMKLVESIDSKGTKAVLSSLEMPVGYKKQVDVLGKTKGTGENFSIDNEDLYWLSLDKNVAHVNNLGIIEGKGVGSTSILAITKSGEFCESIYLSIVEAEKTNTPIDSVKIKAIERGVKVGNTYNLDLEVTPENVDKGDINVVWESHTDVASVTDEGKLTVNKAGNVSVTAKVFADDKEFIAKFEDKALYDDSYFKLSSNTIKLKNAKDKIVFTFNKAVDPKSIKGNIRLCRDSECNDEITGLTIRVLGSKIEITNDSGSWDKDDMYLSISSKLLSSDKKDKLSDNVKYKVTLGK